MAKLQHFYQHLTDVDDRKSEARLPEHLVDRQPVQFFTHVGSLGATKTGDGLVDPKLILTWLLNSMGAPAYLIGLLVPIREALALLPQLFLAPLVQRSDERRWFWVAGSVVQGLSAIGMGLSAFALNGVVGGAVIVALLVAFALGRCVCSTSYKDVLGRTLVKRSRGSATGLAGSIASVLVLGFGAALAFGVLPINVETIGSALLVAGGLWIGAAALFSTLKEDKTDTNDQGEKVGFDTLVSQFHLLGEDRQLVRFIIVRGLLVATALAPPFIVALSGMTGGRTLGSLGAFVIASAVASIASSYVWGRLADRSSRRVLIYAGLGAAAVCAVTALAGVVRPDLLAGVGGPVLLFGLMIAYQGVRLGRSTHIVDMAPAEHRASYTALTNTIIGVVLLVGAIFGVVAALFGNSVVLMLFAAMALAAAWLGQGLDEVQA
jgi:hypothetical protein